MSTISYRDYWSVAAHEVEAKTGAIMDCSDIRDVLQNLDVDLTHKSVLDVGCGTGRVSQLCGTYTGTDVSPAMVAYCRERNLAANITTSPLDLRSFDAPWGDKPFDAVVCFSVFTHIAQSDRQSYLHSFRHCAPELVVDILPRASGQDEGDISAWYSAPAEFELDLYDAGWNTVVGTYERESDDGYTHLYYHCR